jgi:D-alanine-D-alanine ligase
MKITVLMGGTSAERDVSLSSGLRIAQALRQSGHEVTSVDPARGVIDEAEEEMLRAGGVVKTAPPTLAELQHLSRTSLSPTLGTFPAVRTADVVVLALHGGQGEDGTVQALLDMVGVCYTGSGHLASALAMDKDLSKQLFRAAGVQTANWLMVTRCRGVIPSEVEIEQALGWPVVVKPSKQGSTVGLSIIQEAAQLRAAIDEAARYDDEIMLEQFVPGRELTVSVLGDQALPVGEIIPRHAIYDYECKYTPGMAVEEFPARLHPDQAAQVQQQALAAFRALKLDGYARIDFRMTNGGEFFCLEANTLPGMTPTSLLPQAAAAAGMDFPTLCERIVQRAVSKRNRGQ